MRVLVTGARGKVGRVTVAALKKAGHEVRAVDRGDPIYGGEDPSGAPYVQADLGDAGDAYAVVRGCDIVIHAAAFPVPVHNPPHVVFQNNLMATFNTLEAAIRFGVRRFVNVSSETVLGSHFAERKFVPDYLPIDEEHPLRPQDPYATAKVFGEQLMDAGVRRSDIRCISIRPSWVQLESDYERNVVPYLRDDKLPSGSFWSYIDAHDLADSLVLAAESKLKDHEVFFIASPDNLSGRPLADLVRKHHGRKIALREDLMRREDCSGIYCGKAEQMLGWKPTRSWRDYVDPDGALRPDSREQAAPTPPAGSPAS